MIHKNIKAVVFDLDGTLLNSLDDIADCANKTIGKYGITPYSNDDYRHFVGDGLKMLMKRIMPIASDERLIAESMEEFESIYRHGWNNKTRPYPGVLDMLNKLQNYGIKLVVLSNKPDLFTQRCVEFFFQEYRFESVWGKRREYPPKPDPASTFKILDSIDLTPQQSLFVGDSSVDIKTGVAAGMTTLGVSWGFREKSELENAGADLVVNAPEEIIRYVCKS